MWPNNSIFGDLSEGTQNITLKLSVLQWPETLFTTVETRENLNVYTNEPLDKVVMCLGLPPTMKYYSSIKGKFAIFKDMNGPSGFHTNTYKINGI